MRHSDQLYVGLTEVFFLSHVSLKENFNDSIESHEESSAFKIDRTHKFMGFRTGDLHVQRMK